MAGLPISSGARLLALSPTTSVPKNKVATEAIAYSIKSETWGQTIPFTAGDARTPGFPIWLKVNRNLQQREYLTSAGATAASDTEYIYNSIVDVAYSFGYRDLSATTELDTLYLDGVTVDLSKITYTFYNGEQTTADPYIVADKGAANTPAFKGQAYIVIRNLDLSKFSDRLPSASAVMTDDTATKSLEWSIRTRATLLGELSSSDFTFVNMTPVYPGLCVWQNSDLKTHLQNDGLLTGFDFFESGGKIKCSRRVNGATYTSDRTLTEDDLLDLGRGQGVEIVRGDEQDVPAVVHCNYLDPSVEYRMSRQRARRVQTPAPALNSNATADLTTSIIMSASQALTAAAQAMFRMDAGRVSVSFRLPQKHIDIEPGDILVLPTIGTKVFTVKVQEATLREDLSVDVAASVLLTDEDISLTGAEGDGLIIDMSEPSVAVGTAAGVGTASAVSNVTAASAGAASGAGSAIGISAEPAGFATGSSSATGVGASTAEATGTASGAGSASAVAGGDGHRYWRIYVDAIQSGTVTAIMRVEMRESQFGQNKCTGGTASASGAIAGYAASEAFNIDFLDSSTSATQDFWAVSGASGVWLAYDFGSGNMPDIECVDLWARHNNREQTPKDFKVEYSDDGSSWTTKWTVTGQTSWRTREHRKFVNPSYTEPAYTGSPHGSHRRWMIMTTENAKSQTNVVIGEVEFRAAVGVSQGSTAGTAGANTIFSAGFLAANAFAGDGGTTSWASSNTTAFPATEGRLQFYHDTARECAQVMIQARSDASPVGQEPRYFQLFWSDDAADAHWTHAADFIDAASTTWTSGEIRTFTDSAYI